MTSPILPIASAPPAKEETVWHGTPSWTLLLGRLIGLVTALVVIPLCTYLLAVGATDVESRDFLRTLGWILTTVLVVILGISFVVGLIKLRSTRYTVTNQRVLIETGLLTKTVNEIDMRLIDDTLFFQGILHRILGIGMVTVMSTDKNTPMYVLRGISDPRGVRELIRTHSYHASQKQVFTRST